MIPQTPCFLCVHVPEFPAQARLRQRPELHAAAVVILHGTPPLETVCSATQSARKLGVSHGTTRAELDSFTGIEALKRSQQEEESAAAALLATAWRFSPRVQVLTGTSAVHRLVLDITGTERIFGPPEQLAAVLTKEVRALGFTVRLASSENFHAAVCAAPYAKAKPCIIPRGTQQLALASLPIRAVEAVTEEQHDVFSLWGLRTLGQIAALPLTQLVSRMGQAGKRVWLMSRGEHPYLMQPQEERFTLEEQASFDSAVEMLDSLLFALKPMLSHILHRAEGHAFALASVTLRLNLTNHAAAESEAPQEASVYTRTIRPALPLTNGTVLLKLIHLELQAHPPGAPVVGVALEAEPGIQARSQLGLFSPQLPEPSRLDVTLARIRALVGEGRVGRAKLLDSHQPESFIMERFESPTEVAFKESRGNSAQNLIGLKRLRPSQLLRTEAKDATPQAFVWQGVRYEVTAAYGPWRQSGSWWSGLAWSQEEWDLSARAPDGSGLRCRIARDLLHTQWRLEGLYD